MTTNNYLKDLEKKLHRLDTRTKENIIKEIRSYIEDEKLTYNNLIEKFGNVNDLAASYLEDNPLKEVEVKWFKKKRIYIFTLIILITLPLLYIYFQLKDPFDYSLYNENTINKKIDMKWFKIDKVKELNSTQAHLVIYASSKNYLEYACKESHVLSKDKNDILNIKQEFCFIKLPKDMQVIKAYQSKIILIKTQANLNLEFEQSSLDIAEKGSSYLYDIKHKQSDYKDLKSKESNIKLTIKLLQSEAKYYNY